VYGVSEFLNVFDYEWEGHITYVFVSHGCECVGLITTSLFDRTFGGRLYRKAKEEGGWW